MKLAAWVRQEFRPSYDRVKRSHRLTRWRRQQLRATLFGVLGEIGRDPQIIAQAKELTDKYIADQASVEPSLVRPAVMIATENGDSHLFDQLQQLSKTSNNPDVQRDGVSFAGQFPQSCADSPSAGLCDLRAGAQSGCHLPVCRGAAQSRHAPDCVGLHPEKLG